MPSLPLELLAAWPDGWTGRFWARPGRSTAFNSPSVVPLDSCRTCCRAEVFGLVPASDQRSAACCVHGLQGSNKASHPSTVKAVRCLRAEGLGTTQGEGPSAVDTSCRLP